MPTAITRDISPEFADCELTHLPRVAIDLDLAQRQHHAYQAALTALGCTILNLPAGPGMPDCVFIEDTALVLDELAVLCRPGAESRRPEVAEVARALSGLRRLEAIRAPGTLDGGDVLRVGRDLYVGRSARTNEAGIERLRECVAGDGYRVTAVKMRGCLHLKSAVTRVAEGTLLLNTEWVDPAAFGGLEHIAVAAAEPHAANALLLGGRVLFPTAFPRTLEKLHARGIEAMTVDVSELQKAEGGVTCCSLVVTGNG